MINRIVLICRDNAFRTVSGFVRPYKKYFGVRRTHAQRFTNAICF